MITDTEIRQKGMELLSQGLGFVEAERFIALVQREPFDYTQWRRTHLPDTGSVSEISRLAMEWQDKTYPDS